MDRILQSTLVLITLSYLIILQRKSCEKNYWRRQKKRDSISTENVVSETLLVISFLEKCDKREDEGDNNTFGAFSLKKIANTMIENYLFSHLKISSY